jgi:hypothetical protein
LDARRERSGLVTRTYSGPVSRLAETPVATVALKLGRAISGVYNEVMNFRHLDPRDEREGMSGGGDVDARVWEDFFDGKTGELRMAELEAEFTRLWGHDEAAGSPDLQSEDEALAEEARALEHNTLSALMSRYDKEVESRPKRPRASAATTRVFERSPLVIAIARKRANHRCEVPGCEHPVFVLRGRDTILRGPSHRAAVGRRRRCTVKCRLRVPRTPPRSARREEGARCPEDIEGGSPVGCSRTCASVNTPPHVLANNSA